MVFASRQRAGHWTNHQAFVRIHFARGTTSDGRHERLEIIKDRPLPHCTVRRQSNGVVANHHKEGIRGSPKLEHHLPRWRQLDSPTGCRDFPHVGTRPRAGSTTLLDTVQISTRELNDSSQCALRSCHIRTGNLRMYTLRKRRSPTITLPTWAGPRKDQGIERESRLNRSTFRANVTAPQSATGTFPAHSPICRAHLSAL